MRMTVPPSRAPRTVRAAPWLVAAAVAATYLAVADLPFFSESHNHLHLARQTDGWLSALDPAREPLRPLQHLFFWCLAALDLGPAAARVPAFAMHLASCFLVALLARQLGASPAGAWLAAALLALAPTVKSLAWVAAIGTPGRGLFVLLALVSFQRWRERPSPAAGATCFAAFVLALGFHQAAIVLPGLLLLLVWTSLDPAAGRGPRARLAVLRDPLVLSVLVVAVVYFAYQTWFREQRYNRLQLARLPSNSVKASLAVAPEALRSFVVDGLRGERSAVGAVGAAALLVAWIGMAARLLLRGHPVTRFAVAAIALDALLPVVLSGYDHRYAYLSLALAACALGAWWGRAWSARPGWRSAVPAVLLLGIAALDQARDVLEYRLAGGVARAIVVGAAEERARVGPDRAIAVVDVPDMAGDERDVPVFNWGFPFAMEREGSPGPWLLLRTRPFHTSTDFRLVAPEDVARLAREGDLPVLVYDSATRRLERWKPGP